MNNEDCEDEEVGASAKLPLAMSSFKDLMRNWMGLLMDHYRRFIAEISKTPYQCLRKRPRMKHHYSQNTLLIVLQMTMAMAVIMSTTYILYLIKRGENLVIDLYVKLGNKAAESKEANGGGAKKKGKKAAAEGRTTSTTE